MTFLGFLIRENGKDMAVSLILKMRGFPAAKSDRAQISYCEKAVEQRKSLSDDDKAGILALIERFKTENPVKPKKTINRCSVHNMILPASGKCHLCDDSVMPKIEMLKGEVLKYGTMKVSPQDKWIAMGYAAQSIVGALCDTFHEPEKRGQMPIKNRYLAVMNELELLNGIGLTILEKMYNLKVVNEVSSKIDNIINVIADKAVMIGGFQNLTSQLKLLVERFIPEEQQPIRDEVLAEIVRLIKENT